jgi:CshA-type fibril repeat protein
MAWFRSPAPHALGSARTRRVLPLILVGAIALPTAALIGPTTAHAVAAPGGPVVLDGMDSGNHGTESGGVPQGTWHFGELAFQLLMGQSTSGTPNTVAVIGATDSTATGANCGAMAHYAAAALGYTAQYFPNEVDIDSLFSQIQAGTYTPRLIYIADTHCQNGLTEVLDPLGHPAGDATLSAHSTDIASFVNRGGALYAEFSGYAWLRTLIPSITVATAPTGSNPLLTPAGTATFPTLTNADLVSPWHGYFTGSLGTSLQALAAQTIASVSETVIIGGSLVTLPTISTTTHTGTVGVGGSGTVITTAENPDGSPVPGVDVTFTITSGPNVGQTATVTTGADGTASYTYSSLAAGTDVIGTSVTVAGQTYPGSATIVWTVAHPSPPGISNVVQTGSNATVTVTPPVSNGGVSGAPTYTVKAYPGGVSSGSTPIVVTGQAGPTVNLTGLVPGLTYEIVATATNSSGTSDPSPTSWVGSNTAGWAPYAVPVIATTTTPGVVNLPYAESLSIAGGVGPYTWSVSNGTMPAGLTLNADGSITGTPTALGSSIVTVMVMDSNGTMSMATLTLAISPPVPTAAPVTSSGTGSGTQTAGTPVPTGGTVSFVDPSGLPTNVLVVPGIGTYAVVPTTGAITFVPAPGFTGTAPPVHLLVTDAYNQTGTTTYTVSVAKPAAPTAPVTPPTTSGAAGTHQQQQVTVPPGDTIALLDKAGHPATTVTVPGQGTYLLNPTTDVITFTPLPGFHGKATGVTFVITDGYGQSTSSVYTATVTGVAKPATPAVATAAVGVLSGHETSLPVTCKVSSGRIAQCTVTLLATINGRSVVVGTGHRTVGGSGAKGGTAVVVTLNRLGQALSAAPGGVMVTVSAAIKAPGQKLWTYATAKTRLVAALVLAPRQVYFATDSAVLTGADKTYLDQLRHLLTGVKEIVCNGYTDSRASATYNVNLGKQRAAATCAYLIRGAHMAFGPHSYGATNPQADNGTIAGQALNRRTQIFLKY